MSFFFFPYYCLELLKEGADLRMSGKTVNKLFLIKSAVLVSIDLSEGKINNTIDGHDSLGVQNLRRCRALVASLLEASNCHLLLNEHSENGPDFILADNAIAVLIEQLERSCKALFRSASASHAAHDKVLSQIHCAVSVLIKNVKDHTSELRMASRCNRINESLTRDATVFICALFESNHDAIILRFRDLVCFEEFFLLLWG